MATYPSIGLKHDIRPNAPREVLVADSGAVRAFDLGAATTYRISITHPIINATDRDTLLTFYATNKNSTNAITLAGSTYDVLFEDEYRVQSISASYFTLSVTLTGTKQ